MSARNPSSSVRKNPSTASTSASYPEYYHPAYVYNNHTSMNPNLVVDSPFYPNNNTVHTAMDPRFYPSGSHDVFRAYPSGNNMTSMNYNPYTHNKTANQQLNFAPFTAAARWWSPQTYTNYNYVTKPMDVAAAIMAADGMWTAANGAYNYVRS